MAMMVALSSAVSGLKTEQTALDVIANNIANVNTTGYKSQTVTFSDMLSQTISAGSGATATTGSTNSQQIGLGVSIASTDTDLSVGSTSSSSNWTDVALTGSGYFIVQTETAGEYEFSRAGTLNVDDSGNLNIDGYIVCGWEEYTLDADGNKVYNTDGDVEPINIYSDDYSGNKKTLAALETSSADFSGVLGSSADVTAGATGLTSIGDTTDLDYDAASEITIYDEQGNDYDVTTNWKKCAVEGDITTWYWEASADDATISPSSGYVAFDSEGKMVTSATTLSAAVADTAGYTSSNVSVGTGVADGTYNVTVTGTSGAYTVTLSDGTNTYTASSTDGAATFTTGSGTITLSAPAAVSTGTSTFTVASGTAAVTDAGYAYSNVSIGAGSAAGAYSTTVTQNADGSTWDVALTYPDGTTKTVTGSKDGAATFTTTAGTITLSAPTSVQAGTTTFTVASTTTNFDSTPTLTVTTPASAGTDAITVALDFADITTSNTSDSVAGDANGYSAGTASSYSISSDGTIYCTYDNGEKLSIGQIALAVFDNAEGLEKVGGNFYTATISSGDYRTVVAGEGGSGKMTSYAVELSNVDLASQFSSMMISQRAYQANSKVISTSDDMLQSLINMVG
ncbi:flagellar hook-basal body complex protein [Sporomusa malonica]|uniref:Flagellar hook protein FlgE n=1 Tax=Sporomusa malonica TaxID=112901 RepID=A0A1W2EJ77_9FIRM|nr:flagellar hook-basal body complex protein [Sporomusa malonica]SMD09770.1 flagellar hook protein FlgE [Sporomusa malonica]